MHEYTNSPKASSREEKNKHYGCSYHSNRNDSFVREVCACQYDTCLNLPIIILMVPLFPISSLSSSDTARLRSAPMACSTVLRSEL